MSEPTTSNVALIVPNTGDLPGAWGTAALNPNFASLDGLFGGVQTISLSSATTFALTAPAGSITPSGGPNQAQNAVLNFSGTLTGNAVITLPLPGSIIVNNACTVGTNFIQFRAVGTGTVIGIPDGRAVKIWNDGTNVGFCDPPEVASYLELAMATTPSWYAGCSTLPYLVCDGSTYSTAIYPTLGTRLGSTFGGNGITTFGVPDLLSRLFLPLDTKSVNRVTAAGSGINGTTMAAAGGSELMQSHRHANSLTDPGHSHPIFGNGGTSGGIVAPDINSIKTSRVATTEVSTTGITITNVTTGSGSSQNMVPAIVGGLKLIKT